MKARGRDLLIACALAVLALPTVASGAPPAQGPELRLSVIKVEGSNGYGVEVTAVREGDFPADVGVSVDGGLVGASYAVRAELEAGIHATFGSLGQLDVSFERRKKVVERPEPGCRWVAEIGVFRGSFDFTGEGGYFSSSAVNPEGEVIRLPNGFCGFGDDRPARFGIPGVHQTILAARAKGNGRTISFEASRLTFGQATPETSFSASLRERVGEMKIERTAGVRSKAKAFSLEGKSRGSVHPPPPFRGSARFRDPAGGPATWTGSLSVSFPGAPNVTLAGEPFAAKLCPRISLLNRCLR